MLSGLGQLNTFCTLIAEEKKNKSGLSAKTCNFLHKIILYINNFMYTLGHISCEKNA